MKPSPPTEKELAAQAKKRKPRRSVRRHYLTPSPPDAPYLVFIDGEMWEVWTTDEAKRLPEAELERGELGGFEVQVSVYRRRAPRREDDRRVGGKHWKAGEKK